MSCIIALVFLLFASPLLPRAGAQFLTEKPLIPLSDSKLWIEGVTSVSSYKCHAHEIKGFGFLADTANRQQSSESRAVVEVQVPVRKLDCGKPGMNRDMYQALKVEDHPTIHYELKEVQQDEDSLDLSAQKSARWLQIQTTGQLTIAGSTRTVRIQAQGRRMSEQKIRVKGMHRLNMRTYGVNPPTAIFGLVRVKDSLTVHFDLTTAPADTISRQKLQRALGSE